MNKYIQTVNLALELIVLQIIDHRLYVLTGTVAGGPLLGHTGLPGGSFGDGETIATTLNQILTTKVGLEPKDLKFIEQLRTFDIIHQRDSEHSISITYVATGSNIRLNGLGTHDNLHFQPVVDTTNLAYGQNEYLAYAIGYLRDKVLLTKSISFLMPVEFTLTALQDAYEALFDETYDIRNFRKQIESAGNIEATGAMQTGTAFRPARLFQYISNL